MSLTTFDVKPWHREPWPWLLMAGPALVIVAGFVTLWLALTSDDGLVADDYYKRGLAINQVLARDAAAGARRYAAQVVFDSAFDRVRVTLSGTELPAVLLLRMVHPTRTGLDRVVPLAASGPGVYEAALAPPAAGRWQLTLEDPARIWRLSAIWRVPCEAVLQLGAR